MEKLREPKGFFQETVRRLAEAAMSVTHHDIEHDEPAAVREIQSMERVFTRILRGKLYQRLPPPLLPHPIKGRISNHDELKPF